MASFPDSVKHFDRVINLVHDISEEQINDAYDEIEAIQDNLGVNIQGSKSSLNERLATSLDAAGNIRADAVGSAALQNDIVTNAKVFNPDTFDFNSINVGRHGTTTNYGYSSGVGPETATSGVTIDASGNVFINGNLTVEGESAVLNLLSGTQTNLVTENLSVSGNIYLGNEEDTDILTVKGNQTITTNKIGISLEVTQQGAGDLFVFNSPTTELLRLTNNGQINYKPETGGDSTYSGLNLTNTSSNNTISAHYNDDESGRIDLFAADGTSNRLSLNTDTDEDEVFIGTVTDTNLRVKTNNTDRVYIDGTNGYVGINTTNPLARLHVNGDFIVDGATIFTGAQAISGDLLVDGNVVLGNSLTDTVEISGTTEILGQTNIDDDLVVTGTEYLSGNLYMNGSADIDTNLNVDGTANIEGYTTVNDSIEITGTQYLSGNLNVNGSADIDTNLNVDGTANIDGQTNINDNLVITGTQDLSGDLNINGSVDIDINLNVDGTANIEGYTTINDSIEITGTQHLSGNLNVNGSADIDTDLNVDGNTVIDGTALISSYTTIDDSIEITGTQYLSGDLNVNGSTDIDVDLNVDGNTVVDGTVGIGTLNPNSKLEVVGNIRTAYSGSESTYYGNIVHDGSNGLFINSQSATTAGQEINFRTQNSTKMTLNYQGRLGIGSESPNNALDVFGEGRIFNGDATAALKLYAYDSSGGSDTVFGTDMFSVLAFGGRSDATSVDDAQLRGAIGSDSETGNLKFSVGTADLTDITNFQANTAMTIANNKRVSMGTVSADTSTVTIKNQNDSTTSPLILLNDNNNRSHVFSQDTTGNANAIFQTNAGAQNIFLRTSGISYFVGGNVGVGTNNPTATLHVVGNYKIDNIEMDGNTLKNNNSHLYMESSDSLIFSIDNNNNNTNREFVVTKDATGGTGSKLFRLGEDGDHYFLNGHVGIGTTLPETNSLLDMVDSNVTTGNKQIRLQAGSASNYNFWRKYGATAAGTIFGIPYAELSLWEAASDGHLMIRNSDALGNIHFAGTASIAMTIENDGNIGIGTINPGRNLDVYGNNPYVRVRDDNGGYLEMHHDNSYGYLDTNNNIRMRVGTTPTVDINSAGNVGIGTTNPLFYAPNESTTYTPRVMIANSADETGDESQLALFNDKGTAGSKNSGIAFGVLTSGGKFETTNRIYAFQDSTNGAESGGFRFLVRNTGAGSLTDAVRIEPDTRVGINTIPEAGKQLHVNGDTKIEGNLFVTGIEVVSSTEAISGDQLITGNLEVNGTTLLKGTMTFGDPVDSDVIDFKGSTMTFYNNILSSDGTEQIGSSGTPFDLIYVDEVDLGTNRITDGNFFGSWNYNNGTLSNINTATIGTLNITTIDLGTNTIYDGNFTGNWAFDGGNLTNTGNITPNGLGKNLGDSGSNRWATLYMASTIDYLSNLEFSSGGTHVTFTTDGDVGIGLTPSSHRLEVKSTGLVSQNFMKIIDSGDVAQFEIKSNSGGNTVIEISDTLGNTDIQLNSDGVSYFKGGNVSIGTNADAETLHVNKDANDGAIALYRGSNISGAIQFDSTNAGQLNLFSGGTNHNIHLTALGSSFIIGKLGIGITNPSTRVHIYDITQEVLRLTNDENNASTNVSFDMESSMPDTTNQIGARIIAGFSETTSNDNSFMGFETRTGGSANQRTMTLREGRVGIGTIAPFTDFVVANIDNNLNGIGIEGTTNGYRHLITATFDGVSPTTGSALQFKIANDNTGGNTEVMTLKGSGYIGMGTTSPSTNLDIVDSSSVAGLYLSGVSTDTTVGNLSIGSLLSLRNTSNTDNNYSGISFWDKDQATVSFIGGQTTSHANNTGELYFMTRQSGSAIAERMRIDSTGNFGINTTDIEAWDGNYTGIEFYRSAIMAGRTADNIFLVSNAYYDGDWKRKSGDAGALVQVGNGAFNIFRTDAGALNSIFSWTHSMIVDASGKVGIGTSSPVDSLHIHGGAGTTKLRITDVNTGATDDNGLAFIIDGSQNKYIWNEENTDMYFGCNDATKMTIDNDGNVGIGVSPSYPFHVETSVADNIAYFRNTDTTNGYGPLFRAGGTAAGRWSFNVQDAALNSRLVVLANGSTGLNASSPKATLQVGTTAAIDYDNGASTFVGFNFYINGTTSIKHITTNEACYTQYDNDGNIRFYTTTSGSANAVVTATQRMLIENGGNVGIGKTPTSKLDVAGTITTSSHGTSTNWYSVYGNYSSPFSTNPGHKHSWNLGVNSDATTAIFTGETVRFRNGSNITITRSSNDVYINCLDAFKWDGGSSGLNKSTARTSLELTGLVTTHYHLTDKTMILGGYSGYYGLLSGNVLTNFSENSTSFQGASGVQGIIAYRFPVPYGSLLKSFSCSVITLGSGANINITLERRSLTGTTWSAVASTGLGVTSYTFGTAHTVSSSHLYRLVINWTYVSGINAHKIGAVSFTYSN